MGSGFGFCSEVTNAQAGGDTYRYSAVGPEMAEFDGMTLAELQKNKERFIEQAKKSLKNNMTIEGMAYEAKYWQGWKFARESMGLDPGSKKDE